MKNYIITYEKPTKNGYKECKRYTNNARKAFKIADKVGDGVFVYNIQIFLIKRNSETGNIESELIHEDKTTFRKGEIDKW